MWPLTGSELVAACAGRCTGRDLDAIAIRGVCCGAAPPRSDELFVALREDARDTHGLVVRALEFGAPLALVSASWEGLGALAPELAARCIVVDDSTTAFRRLAGVFRRRFSFPVVAVAGSNGKTTTKEMLAALLGGPGRRITKTPETMNGWTGIPYAMCQREHATDEPPEALVLEVGIDTVGAMASHGALVDPDLAVLTALGPEHLTGLGTWETAVIEELRLFDASPRLRRVFNADDPALRARLGEARDGDVITYADDGGCDHGPAIEPREHDALIARGLSLLSFRVRATSAIGSEVAITSWPARGASGASSSASFFVPTPGRHHAYDLALAAACALALGRTLSEIALGWSAYDPPGMRLTPYELPGGCLLLDDSYNASPWSVKAALDVLASPPFERRPKLVVLGDMLDLGDAAVDAHAELVGPLASLEHAQILLFGESVRSVHEALTARAAAPLGHLTRARADRPLPFWLSASEDPVTLLDRSAVPLDGAVVLLKGSRGMQLERVAAEIVRRATEEPSSPRRRIGIVGSEGRDALCRLLVAALAHLGHGGWEVIDLDTDALDRGHHALGAFAVGVFTGLTEESASAAGVAERSLARMAQLFMALEPRGVAIVPGGDDASELLVETVAEGTRIVRYDPHDGEKEGTADVIHEATLEVLEAVGLDRALARGAIEALKRRPSS